MGRTFVCRGMRRVPSTAAEPLQGEGSSAFPTAGRGARCSVLLEPGCPAARRGLAAGSPGGSAVVCPPGRAAGTWLFFLEALGQAERTAHQRKVVTFTDSSTLPPAAAVPVPSVLSTYKETSLQLPYKSGAAPRSHGGEFGDAGRMFAGNHRVPPHPARSAPAWSGAGPAGRCVLCLG